MFRGLLMTRSFPSSREFHMSDTSLSSGSPRCLRLQDCYSLTIIMVKRSYLQRVSLASKGSLLWRLRQSITYSKDFDFHLLSLLPLNEPCGDGLVVFHLSSDLAVQICVPH